MKNILALISGLIVLSKRFCNTPKELATNIRGRFDALAMAHELILPRSASEEADATAESARLNDLLRKILSAYDFQDSKGHRRLVMSGPPVAVGPRAVTSFALFVHELGTNAAKYGALSVPTGSVNVLVMTWEERGGPRLAGQPVNEGFGTVLLNHSVRGQFGGTLS